MWQLVMNECEGGSVKAIDEEQMPGIPVEYIREDGRHSIKNTSKPLHIIRFLGGIVQAFGLGVGDVPFAEEPRPDRASQDAENHTDSNASGPLSGRRGQGGCCRI